MEEYYFLFGIGILWTVFASFQDLKKREVANWLNFSLIIFALAYRAFYSYYVRDYNFFFLGFLGFVVFFVLAHALYYTKVFAGGDAKLLMGYGVILPYANYQILIPTSLLFLFLLFFVGAGYSIIYSVIVIGKNKKKFIKEFKKRVERQRVILIVSIILFVLLVVLGFTGPLAFVFALFLLIPLIWTYTKSLDKCMIKFVSPMKLTEGDWLEKNVKLSSGRMIKKTVHGLSLKDIKLLKKHKKKVLIKEGIPFVPVFLITLLIMVFFFLVSEFSVEGLISFLF